MADLDDITAADAQARPPQPEYEDITIREVAIGFAGSPPQDFTLYPEDSWESDNLGNIRIVFHTMGGGEFVAYAGHAQWHSLREVPHKRAVGTLRVDPRDVARQFMQNRERNRAARALAEGLQKDRITSEVDA